MRTVLGEEELHDKSEGERDEGEEYTEVRVEGQLQEPRCVAIPLLLDSLRKHEEIVRSFQKHDTFLFTSSLRERFIHDIKSFISWHRTRYLNLHRNVE